MNILYMFIAKYSLDIPHKLLDWIPKEKMNWDYLSRNPAAIQLLEKNLDKINWNYLYVNPAAIHLLEKNLDKINWNDLSHNPVAIQLLKNINKINWDYLNQNGEAIHLLEKNPEILSCESMFEIDNNMYKKLIIIFIKIIDLKSYLNKN